MAKNLELAIGDKVYPLTPVKLERKKVYGWTELKATTTGGLLCRQVGLDNTGQTIIPKWAVKQGILIEDGIWMEKTELVAVNTSGEPLEQVPSSFDGQIILSSKVTEEFFMDHLISSVYQLDGESSEALAALVGNDIYTFPFSYRGGYKASVGFLMGNGTNVFIFAGEQAQFEFIGLEELGVLDEPEDEMELDDDDIDFSMM